MDYASFCKDDKAMYAVIRAFEIIGEAARQIPEDVRNYHPEIQWREITGMRNKLTHEYFGVNTEVIWRTVQEDLPAITPALRKMLKKKKDSERNSRSHAFRYIPLCSWSR
ncbi:MAG: DUF86 domain-containing protein [Chloroflexi bacterium]|nr:DUF86 domain-containing protein [Chloroflexota bacterium]